MQVRGSTTSAPAGPGGKPDRAVVAHGALRRESGRRFGGLVAGGSAVAPPSVRSGIIAAAASARPAGAAPVPVAASVVRVLIGGGPGAAEARIRIADGAGGSAELRLASVAGGGGISVQVLTAAAGSREMLAGVMNEVRLRLRRRGIALTEAVGGDSLRERDRGGRPTP